MHNFIIKGHGSNVRGIETTAEYDPKTDEFIINTPNLRSIKWWPGALGKLSTHAVLMAQLILDGKEHGVKVFMIQIRDENHLPLKGITIGDLGVKIGDNSNDTGFMSINNVRIPRTHILSKYETVTKEGKLVTVLKASPQVHYSTMTLTRAIMIYESGTRLCQASTIAIRYSCVRRQGFRSFSSGISYKSEENSIVDHRIQQYRLFKQLAHGYAFKFIGIWISEQIETMEGGELGVLKNTGNLKELAITSAGLKSLCTQVAANGIEDLRKCCGGNGYLMNSGIAALRNEYLVQVTAEGDMAVMAVLFGKFMVQTVDSIQRGEKITGLFDYLNVLKNKNFSVKSLHPPKSTSNTNFMNTDYLLTLFAYKSIFKSYILYTDFVDLVQNKGIDFQKAFEMLAMEAVQATYAHGYYMILLTFIKKIKEITNVKIVHALTRLKHYLLAQIFEMTIGAM